MADNDSANSSLQNRKPCFEITNSQIFVNLHNAACEKAAKILKLNAKDPSINQFIINTGMTTDGKTVSPKIDSKNKSDIGKAFSVGDHKYEVGIVLQFTEFKAPSKEDLEKHKNDEWKTILDFNSQSLKKYKDFIFKGMQEYFKWFSGQSININDMVEFVPDYNGGKIEIVGPTIKSMTDEDRNNYLMHRIDDKKGEKDDAGNNFIPRLGYKVGYTIVFK